MYRPPQAPALRAVCALTRAGLVCAVVCIGHGAARRMLDPYSKSRDFAARGRDIRRCAPWCARAAADHGRPWRPAARLCNQWRAEIYKIALADGQGSQPSQGREEMIELILITCTAACTGGLLLGVVLLHRIALRARARSPRASHKKKMV